jgi:hypothetical protein
LNVFGNFGNFGHLQVSIIFAGLVWMFDDAGLDMFGSFWSSLISCWAILGHGAYRFVSKFGTFKSNEINILRYSRQCYTLKYLDPSPSSMIKCLHR